MNLKAAQFALQFPTGNWTLADFRLLADLCANQIKCEPTDLIRVLCIESGLDPTAVAFDPETKAPVAVGLNQISRYAAAEIGLIPRDRSKNYGQWLDLVAKVRYAPIGTQLYLVARYFDSVPWGKTGKPYTAVRLYQSNFLPYTLPGKTGPEDVLAERGDQNYAGNSGLDISPADGKITNADLASALSGVPYAARTALPYEAAVTMLKAATAGT